MPSLREIRGKTRAVRAQQRIFKAMKMIAAARMRRAQGAILASRPFAVRMEEAVRDLALLEVSADIDAGREMQIHPFFDARPEGRPCLVLVSADKGLCGSFNAGILRAALDWLRRRQAQRPVVLAVGRKSRDFVRRLRGFDLEIAKELAGIFPKVNYAHAELLGQAAIDAFTRGGCASVDAIYNEFKSVALQRVTTARLLPITVPQGDWEMKESAYRFKFEPGRERLLEALLPRFIKAQLYRILLESQAAELAARMKAMDAASKNAGELIGSLTLRLNRTRQAMITREIAELVGGAEALAA